ncbi:MAG: hypothetical protein L3J12_01980, partial [Spirochaetales bacterium]|nr:hypothetical protein [Spirochaetales bacterium]
TYLKIPQKKHNRDDHPDTDMKIMQEIINDRKIFILPGVVKGAGQFPDSDPRIIDNNMEFSFGEIENRIKTPPFFEDYKKAYLTLVLSLVIQTSIAIERINAPKGAPIYIEGGFRHNKNYVKLLASIFPDSPLFLTNIEEATSYGAALLGKAAMEKRDTSDLKEFVNIAFKLVNPEKIDNFSSYANEFLTRI